NKICKLKKDRGPCHSNLVRRFYNIDTGVCGVFLYGGCLGNQNRFFTEEECRTTCAEVSSIQNTGR
ncbi:unnamed protein product, partial [Candidula unifasciata]